MFKLAKEIFRINKHVGNYSSIQKKRISLDEMHKPYVRSKRSCKNLPDSYTHTRWIHRIKNWKHKSKIKHQWEKHKKTLNELDICENNKALKNQFLYILKTKYKNSWYEFIYLNDTNLWSYDVYYSIAIELVQDGILEGKFFNKTWNFEDFGILKTYSKKILIAVKLKS